MFRKILIPVLALFFCAGAQPQCECAEQYLEKYINDASLIVHGVVKRLKDVSFGNKKYIVHSGYSCRVQAVKFYKGSTDSIFTLFVKDTGCKLKFETGKEYLFYAIKGSNDIYHADKCSKLFDSSLTDLKVIETITRSE